MKNDVKYDAFNNLDTDFYVEKAYKLRREYHATLVKNAVASVKAYLTSLTVRTLKSA